LHLAPTALSIKWRSFYASSNNLQLARCPQAVQVEEDKYLISYNTYLNRWWFALILGAMLAVCHSRTLVGQQPAPWTGIVRDEAEQAAGAAAGFSVVHGKALSADARFLVFESDRTLVSGDGNGAYDAFLRDRHTGQLQRVSVGTDGAEGSSHSFTPSISADGSHVVFRSLASNFDPADTNGSEDIYLRDLNAASTTRISVGPNEEQSVPSNASLARVSGDGRFVVFTANFNTSAGHAAWLRDRDADGNGVFDEPGSLTTTLISAQSVGASDQIAFVDTVAISNDARYVAYSASTVDATNTSIGFRVFLHDRVTGTTVRVDTPLPTAGDVHAGSRDPDVSDAGELVYTSTAPNLVPEDADALSDVFVYNIASGSNSRLQLTHLQASFTETFGTAISADGRYVAFTGYEVGTPSGDITNVYAIDRQSQASFDISVRPDGSRDNASLGASISADGGAIAFMGSPAVIRDTVMVGGVYVATALAVSPSETDVPIEGGQFPVEVSVPADVAWNAKLVITDAGGFIEFGTYSGVGPGTVDIDISMNQTGGNVTYRLWLGSKEVQFHQAGAPIVYSILPNEGPATGGTAFELTGFGFQPDAAVTFDGVPATDLVIDPHGYFITGITPPHLSGPAIVAVTNPGGSRSVDEVNFWYIDETAPILTPTVTGQLGANGWYVGNVSVTWLVQEDESELFEVSCDDVEQTTDVAARVVTCYANSDGGQSTEQVTIKRDATMPSITVAEPQARTYAQGESVAIDFSCADATSGMASCTANQTGTLDTSAPGTLVFTAVAIDAAGNEVTHTVSYTVKARATLDASLASGVYGGVASLTSRLVTASGPIANATVIFYLDGIVAATATTSATGHAAATVSLAGRHAGSLALRAEYAGDANTLAAVSNTTTLTIMPATLRIAAIDATKVYGEALPTFSGFGEGFVSGDTLSSLTGALSFSTAATAASAPGSYPVTPQGVSSADYAITFVPGTLAIRKAATAVALTSSPNPSQPNQTVTITATITVVAPGAGSPTGTVEFRDQGVVIGSAPIVNGVATVQKKLKKGSHALTATYSGNANFMGSSGSHAHETN
jgi:Tol biopolymer transport system component